MKEYTSLLGYPFCVRLTQKVEARMDYRSHVAQTPLFPKRPKWFPFWISRSSVTFQYSDISANRESDVICLLVLVSHSCAYRNALSASWKRTKKKCRSFIKPSISDKISFYRLKKNDLFLLCMILFTQCSLCVYVARHFGVVIYNRQMCIEFQNQYVTSVWQLSYITRLHICEMSSLC